MKKSVCNNNVQGLDVLDNFLTQKKEGKNNLVSSLQENINNPLLYKSGAFDINLPSGISCKNQIFPSDYPITPLKKNHNLIYSSNKSKNLSSSGLMWNKCKNFNNNSNIKNNNNVDYTKRKLFVSNMTQKSILNQNNNFNFAIETFLNNNENIDNNIPLFTPPKKSKQEESTKEKVKEEKNYLIEKSNKATNKLFFTDYGLGYKCNCTKTGCNKYYCQCYNQGRYCYECNCQNCQNQKPDYISSNKRPKDTEEKQKTIAVSCTCTKSACNKNYCECFKNKVKCNSQCRCRNCENIESEKKEINFSEQQKSKYECCQANNVFIIKNEITVEDLQKKNKKIKIIINDFPSMSSSSENILIGKKNKRNDIDNSNPLLSNKKSKISEENTDESIKGKKNDYNESDLFDKEGKLILTHVKL